MDKWRETGSTGGQEEARFPSRVGHTFEKRHKCCRGRSSDCERCCAERKMRFWCDVARGSRSQRSEPMRRASQRDVATRHVDKQSCHFNLSGSAADADAVLVSRGSEDRRLVEGTKIQVRCFFISNRSGLMMRRHKQPVYRTQEKIGLSGLRWDSPADYNFHHSPPLKVWLRGFMSIVSGESKNANVWCI